MVDVSSDEVGSAQANAAKIAELAADVRVLATVLEAVVKESSATDGELLGRLHQILART